MLEVNQLTTKFKVDTHDVTAVNNISFTIPPKKTIGLVGESGSGKSVTALSILNLLPQNGYHPNGSILWNGQNLLGLSNKALQKIRGSEIGLIFQNPLAALNPVFTIGNQLIETIQLHTKCSKEEAKNQAIALLKRVNIPDAETRFYDYPHQFSIGMCQRIVIALTLSIHPKLVIADEPTASLDVTIQAQIIHLLNELKEEFDMSILLISHDLGVIAQNCDEILIMYLGHIVEKGTPHSIFKAPKHPYTKALISAIPSTDPDKKSTHELLHGEIPSPMNLPSGCPFHPRCPIATDRCSQEKPTLQNTSSHDAVACFYA